MADVPQPTLILIDLQQAFEDGSWGRRNNPELERNLEELLAGWRRRGAPIIHVRHESQDPSGRFVRGTSGFDYKREAAPRHGEPEIVKKANNAFVATDLEERLRRDGVTTVAIAGMTTDHCCSTTARMASDLGFETWVLDDGLATFERRAPDGELISAQTLHRAEITSLSGEFGQVLSVADALERLG